MIQVYHQEKRIRRFYALSISDEIRIFSAEKPASFEAMSTPKTVRFREPLTEFPLFYFPSSPLLTRPR